MNLTGTIDITPNWAQLDLDPGQALEGYVILMRDPLASNPTDTQRIAAARRYFRSAQGLHYTLTGQLQGSDGRQFLLVTNDLQG
jgi:hypothetical protein